MTPAHPVLVVDDNAMNRDMLSRRLTRAGYAAECVASGTEALAFLASRHACLVLLDVQMDDINGLDVLQAIRRDWPAARLPVIMVTARDASQDVVTALDLGADDYVTKPIDFAVALARIRTQLARKDAEDRLRASEERYALAARGANDGLWDWDLASGEVFYSDRFAAILGEPAGALAATLDAWCDRVHGADVQGLRHALEAHVQASTAHFEHEHRIRHHSGAVRWVRARGLGFRNDDGHVARLAGSLSDITASRVVDATTGLPNRTLLTDRLERRLAAQGQDETLLAVLILDLDDFKTVNDSLGQVAGDQLLQETAGRLQEALRATEPAQQGADGEPAGRREPPTLARLAGDEFVVLLPDVRDAVEASRVAERLQEALAPPFMLHDQRVFTTASIGLVLCGNDRAMADAILRDADTALTRAKGQGPGRLEVFDTVMREQVVRRLRLDTDLRLAVERREFVPHFQPIIDLASGAIAAFEALIRWQHPSRGLIYPDEFIATIEDNGLVSAVGQQFFTDVCRRMHHWQRTYPHARSLSVNVNFAAPQLAAPRMVDDLLEALETTGLSPEHLVVEVTESTAIADLSRVRTVLGEIRRAGIRIVLDDFGTGYSSLACLHDLPITGLKLDRAFVQGERAPAFVGALVSLAAQLGLIVTAEGIESTRQRALLEAMGCTYGQGYLFSRPVDAAEAEAHIAGPRTWPATEPQTTPS